MKKVLSLVLALVMMLSVMMIGANAASSTTYVNDNEVRIGHVYTVDGSKLMKEVRSNIPTATDKVVSYAEPGTSVYLILCKRDANSESLSATNSNLDADGIVYGSTQEKINRVRIYPDSDSKTAVAKNTNATVKKTLRAYGDGTTYWVGVEIPIKDFNVTVNTYDEPVDCCLEIEVDRDGAGSNVNYTSFSARYEDQSGIADVDEATIVMYYESGDDIDVCNEDASFELEAVATGKALAKVSMNQDTIDEIEEIYGDYASLVYYNGKGSITRIKNGTITIAADGCKYLYKYENGVLVDLSSYYNAAKDAFEMKVTGTSYTFGTYVVSDAKLSSVKAPASTTTTTTSSGTAVKPVVPTTSGSTVKPVIPNTGVALELQ